MIACVQFVRFEYKEAGSWAYTQGMKDMGYLVNRMKIGKGGKSEEEEEDKPHKV